ncbi:hypothetical protein GYMLUDRAFT_246977 [Collybiopsis luxurians FD-317 M1]|uniref:Alanine dehydrogenase/pyridine nucleotide transhydrogenase N-terminal domain-containing protein n=1 Tax=Collybiopsis luxurians FD-317 M1 TaxID=944289 RepID=A0A0D0CGL3_9AGAR|nr:hypothetical protein GYMLUDRAFT_246977 [Collybiopsis luxurians FD-317 M1]
MTSFTPFATARLARTTVGIGLTARLCRPVMKSAISCHGSTFRHHSTNPLIIGIRREDPTRVWERRVPLTPEHVKEFTKLGHRDGRELHVPVEIHVQSCSRRIFTDSEYANAGAKITEDLSRAHVVIGIKEPRLQEVLVDPLPWPGTKKDGNGAQPMASRTYVMFSHTAKGQEYNMPLLSKFLSDSSSSSSDSASLLPTLIDYELLTDDSGKRTLAFGHHAGLAGTLLSLHTLALYQLSKFGVATPFLYTPLPQSMPKLYDLRKALKKVGDQIVREGTGETLGPCVIAVTGTGNVAQGCLAMLSELPLETVHVHELEDLVLKRTLRGQQASLNKVYLVHVKAQHYLVRTSGSTSSSTTYFRDHYYANPSQYSSIFPTKIAPYLTLLLNGAGWAPGFPRLMSNNGLKECVSLIKAMGKEKEGRFGCVGDISCDPYGGLEFLTHSTTLSDPHYKIDVPVTTPKSRSSPSSKSDSASHELWIQAVDILPASLPFDASKHFSRGLWNYLRAIGRRYAAYTDWEKSKAEDASFPAHLSSASVPVEKLKASLGFEERGIAVQLEEQLRRATIAAGGRLVGRFGEGGKDEWLGGRVREYRAKVAANSVPVGSKKTTPSVAHRLSGSGFSSNLGSIRSMASVSTSRPKRILLLGSGMVAGPAVRHIAKRKDVELIVASKEGGELATLEADVKDGNNVQFRQVDVGDTNKGGELRELMKDVDVVMSLLPVALHVRIAELCIEEGKHLVTASYISPEMKGLNERALAANVLLLNEIGLDPGIDHCSAISLIERLKSSGKQVKSFVSFCGGLPASELLARRQSSSTGSAQPSAGPLSYKFSWSPRGVLTAALNGARYRLRGEEVIVPGPGVKGGDVYGDSGELLKNNFPAVEFGSEGGLAAIVGMLEGLPNRDSLPYAEMYGLSTRGENVRTVLRGTLRYKGFSSLMSFFHDIGMLEAKDEIPLKIEDGARSLERAWLDVFSKSARLRKKKHPSAAVVMPDLALKENPDSENVRALKWLLSEETGTPIPNSHNEKWVGLPPLPTSPTAPLDLFALLLAHKLRYAPGERDMVVMVHEITTSTASPDVTKDEEEEIHTSSLVIYGDNSSGQYESAMARSVGVPVAVAALAVLDGAVAPVSPQAVNVMIRGVHGPGHESIRERVLEGMEEAGIGMRESMRRVKIRRANGTMVDPASARRSVENSLSR